TSFTTGTGPWAVSHVREVFASPVDQVIVMRVTAAQAGRSGPRGQVGFTLGLQSPQQANSRTDGDDVLILEGRNGAAEGISGALKCETRVKVILAGGSLRADGQQLHVRGARAALILIAGATSFRRYDDVSGDPAALNAATLAAAGGKTYDQLLDAHTAEHQ